MRGCMHWKTVSWKSILLIVLGAFVFLWLIKAPIISMYMSHKMRVPVSVASISVWPSETTIHNFKLKNPSGFKTRRALEVATVKVEYQFEKLVGSPCVIDKILLQDVLLNIECAKLDPSCRHNNFTAISDGMPKAPEPKAGEESKTEVKIGKVILLNVKVNITGMAASEMPSSTTIARMEFDDIDSANGFPTSQLIAKIFQQAGMNNLIENAFGVPAGIIRQIENIGPSIESGFSSD